MLQWNGIVSEAGSNSGGDNPAETKPAEAKPGAAKPEVQAVVGGC